VIEVKVAVANWILFALAAVDWFTRHDFATACVAVAVNVRTTVEDFGDEPEMSVTVPKARAKPFVVSSVSVGLPQSPFVAPVTELAMGETSQNENGKNSGTGAPYIYIGDSPAGGDYIKAPHDRYKQTDKGDVRVSVGHRLLADRHDSDHRN